MMCRVLDGGRARSARYYAMLKSARSIDLGKCVLGLRGGS